LATSIKVCPDDAMSSTMTGERPRRISGSGKLSDTCRSPVRVFCRTVHGAARRAATFDVHCALSASGPTMTGFVTFAAIHSDTAGIDETQAVGMEKTSSSDFTRCRCGSTVVIQSKVPERNFP
jgi:hypothetical protein